VAGGDSEIDLLKLGRIDLRRRRDDAGKHLAVDLSIALLFHLGKWRAEFELDVSPLYAWRHGLHRKRAIGHQELECSIAKRIAVAFGNRLEDRRRLPDLLLKMIAEFKGGHLLAGNRVHDDLVEEEAGANVFLQRRG